jgi:hypothetical protein
VVKLGYDDYLPLVQVTYHPSGFHPLTFAVHTLTPAGGSAINYTTTIYEYGTVMRMLITYPPFHGVTI